MQKNAVAKLKEAKNTKLRFELINLPGLKELVNIIYRAIMTNPVNARWNVSRKGAISINFFSLTKYDADIPNDAIIAKPMPVGFAELASIFKASIKPRNASIKQPISSGLGISLASIFSPANVIIG